MDTWSRRREVARGVLRSSPKPPKRSIFCHRRGIENFCRLFSTHPWKMFLYQTPGRRPPFITGRVVNTVTRGWVGAPNERAPFRIHDAVVGFVDRCLSGLGISPLRIKHLAEFFSGDFFGIFGKFETFFLKTWICAHSERYRSLMAGIFEIQTFLATSRLCCHRSYPGMFIFVFLRLSSSDLLLSASTYSIIYLYVFFFGGICILPHLGIHVLLFV